MFPEVWYWIIGAPIVAVLAVIAIRRTKALTDRIAEVRREMAANPQDPYSALAMLMMRESLFKDDHGKNNRQRGANKDV